MNKESSAGPPGIPPRTAAAGDAPGSAERLLRDSGARVTRIRLRVLGSLMREGYPLSQVELAALPELKACDRVTLYRTLKALRGAGLVHAVQGVDGAWRFCAHPPDRPGCPGNHPHFLCLGCGRMICLSGQSLPHVDVPADMRVHGKQLVAYGLCRECAQQDTGGRGKRRGVALP